jgi:hypothetical protein
MRLLLRWAVWRPLFNSWAAARLMLIIERLAMRRIINADIAASPPPRALQTPASGDVHTERR